MKSNRRLAGLEASRGISPYCLPVINTFVTPVPPPTRRKEREVKVAPSRGRRLRPSNLTAAKVNEVLNSYTYCLLMNGTNVNISIVTHINCGIKGYLETLLSIQDSPMLKSSVQQSRVTVNMIYFGKKVHLSHDLHDTRDEVKVFQQHCGGENLCVYKGLLHGGGQCRRPPPSSFGIWGVAHFHLDFGNTRNVPVHFKETPRLPLQPDLLPQRPAGGEAELLLRV